MAVSDGSLASPDRNGIIAIDFNNVLANYLDNAGGNAYWIYRRRTNIKEPVNVAIGDEAGRYATGSKNTLDIESVLFNHGTIRLVTRILNRK